jgi:hypothetical protein
VQLADLSLQLGEGLLLAGVRVAQAIHLPCETIHVWISVVAVYRVPAQERTSSCSCVFASTKSSMCRFLSAASIHTKSSYQYAHRPAAPPICNRTERIGCAAKHEARRKGATQLKARYQKVTIAYLEVHGPAESSWQTAPDSVQHAHKIKNAEQGLGGSAARSKAPLNRRKIMITSSAEA